MAERLTRAKVVAYAADLADELGLEQVTFTRLGRSLGIAPPGVYRHVTDVADLRGAIGQLAAHEASVVVSKACAGLSGREALSGIIAALRGWANDHPGRYAALQVAPDLDDAEGQAAAGEILAVIASALRAYALSGDDLTDAVRLIRSTTHGFISLELSGGFKQPRPLATTLDRVIDALDTVLRSWGEAGSTGHAS
ncbi:MAG: WHG domain-containing protein [Propioniciclava sp.]|uniref:TetR/AcrR family transcriptional regulator n=1 Tax=Propioniciclava sp. TaxID=2038686 RepID=UPI0039E6133F